MKVQFVAAQSALFGYFHRVIMQKINVFAMLFPPPPRGKGTIAREVQNA